LVKLDTALQLILTLLLSTMWIIYHMQENKMYFLVYIIIILEVLRYFVTGIIWTSWCRRL